MNAKLYELSGASSACTIRRNVTYDFQSGEKDHIQKSNIIISLIQESQFDGLGKWDIEARLKEKFKELPYISDKQRRVQATDALEQIFRYVDSENRKMYPAKRMDVPLNSRVTASDVKPHLLTWGKTKDGMLTLEVIRLKCKKPDVTTSSAGTNLELYALLKYGRMLIPEGQEAFVKASFYFLRKQNDSKSREKAVFDKDFFVTTGGRNIVSIWEYYTKPAGSLPETDPATTDTDLRFEPLLNAFATGMPEEACSESDCKTCEFMPICKFADPPMTIEKPKKIKDASLIRLTPAQRQAIEYEKGIVRINAGAGAGKTLTIAMRVVTLLEKGVKPEEIFLVTFTNAGAQEMRDRIATIAEDDGIADEVDMSKMKIMTFNAFGDEVIKAEYERFGLDEAPHLIDDVEKSKVIATMLNEHEIAGLDYRNFTSVMPYVKGALPVASYAFGVFKKNPSLGLGDLDELYRKMDTYKRFCPKEAFEKLYELFSDYDRNLRDNSLIEYDDQENMIFELLDMEPYYFEKFGFRHIIVDEFQDTSERQVQIIKRLVDCKSFESLMVVGDDSQSIYSFRNTTPDYIINFDKKMGCTIDDIQLVENHRSTPEIIEFANKINQMNVHRIHKDLVATRAHGVPVTVKGFLNNEDEREYVVEKIAEHIKDGAKPEDIAVLARTKTELNKIADMLSKKGIPSVVQFPERYLDDSRVQAAISLLRAIKDDTAKTDLLVYANALWYVTNGNTLKNATKDAYEKACDNAMVKISAFRATKAQPEEERKKFLKALLDELDADQKDSLYQSFIETLMLRSVDKIFEYTDDFCLFGKDQAERRAGNYPGVVLSTAHSSKGLEWPICFNMISKYDKKELHARSRTAQERIEEERRLLFVSATRARDVLYITAQYTSGGKAGEYLYNQFLQNAYEANGQEFNITHIEQERHQKKLKKEQERREAKEREKIEKAFEEAQKAG